MKHLYLIVILLGFSKVLFSQVNEDKLGAWYIYTFNSKINNSQWDIKGDVQYRNWNIMGDLEQLLLRGGVSYSPKSTHVNLTVGYAFIASGEYGVSNSYSEENRIYQEAILPQKIGERLYFKHRFRFEERFRMNQKMRTRLRYNILLNIPLNNKVFSPKTVYLSLYNELFINGERAIGDGQTVEFFDRNRSYAAIGYMFSSKLKVQLGIMGQLTNSLQKNQLQLSVVHKL